MFRRTNMHVAGDIFSKLFSALLQFCKWFFDHVGKDGWKQWVGTHSAIYKLNTVLKRFKFLYKSCVHDNTMGNVRDFLDRNMNKSLFKITYNQTRSVEEKKVDITTVDNSNLRKQLIARIENITMNIIQQITSGQLPQISNSKLQNYSATDAQSLEENLFESEILEDVDSNDGEFEENEGKIVADFSSKRGKDKFALMITILAAIHRLLLTNTTVTRRSLYYDLKNEKTSSLVPDQRTLDHAVNHVANLLNCAPWELNLLPTAKGLIAGDLTLTLVDNRMVDCSAPGGALIPHIASNVISIRAKANFVLIVEKDSVFQKLLESNFTSSMNCILVTGKGYPDVATRMIVKLLSAKLSLPVYIMVDADPFGVDIMFVYRFGSATLSKERESLACSNARWLGVHPSELSALGINTVALTDFDLSKLQTLDTRPYVTDAMLRELKIMRNGKAEIENVSSSSRNFLAATYLPCKIKGDDFI